MLTISDNQKSSSKQSKKNPILPFADYIDKCRTIIQERRQDLRNPGCQADKIITANSPFENAPLGSANHEYGALLVHGLFDCPFSLRDLGARLAENGIFNRGILLPGHGTLPADLLQVSYRDWIETVRYGIASLKERVDKIFIVGFSTGAALAVEAAIQNEDIAGIILLAPAIKIKLPVDIVVGCHYLVKRFSQNQDWVYQAEENDYTKYMSVVFNAVNQVTALTKVVRKLDLNRLRCPVFLSVSREDETISSDTAIDFFTNTHHPESELLLYTSLMHRYTDKRIHARLSHFKDLNIAHLSHVGMPFSPDNPHYGQMGDFISASHHNKQHLYGAYNHLEEGFFDMLNDVGIVKMKRRSLTYNPDFDFLANKIVNFVLTQGKAANNQSSSSRQ